MKVTEELIWLCLNELATQAARKQKYKDYYDGNHAILKDYAMQDSRSNRKLIFNFPRKFVDNETGYLLGKPVNFISKSDNQGAVDCIDTNLSYWDKGHNINLRKQSEIFGESYELQYINSDGEFCATVLTPLNCYCLVDGT
ncbi:MAG: phage portal protein, partial [Epulopiscium sp.]|nr:phage portal protein [Candidatus Epulonipiscium sp.]